MPTTTIPRSGRRGRGAKDEAPQAQELVEAAKARRRHPTGRKVETRSGAHNPMFLGIAFLVAVFNLLGLVMVLSASSVAALDQYGSSWYYVIRQATWATIGAAMLVAVSRIDYHRWRRMATPMLLVALSALVAVLIPGVGVQVNGAQRWLGAGPLTIQPAEMVKLAFLIWIADLLARRGAYMRNTKATLRPVVVVLAVIAGLVMLQPNLGTTMVIAAIALALCFVAGVPLAPMVRWASAAATVALVLAVLAPYRRSRVLSFLSPWADPLGQGYQQIQSLVGLASGGVAGTGLGASRSKWGYLPFAHSDFIFAVIGEELGLVGALVVVALFMMLGILGIRIALHAPDRFGMFLAVGITSWFLVQAFVNIGAVIGVLPITGVPLPFVSYGGSSLMFNMAGAGMLLAVARQAAPTADAAATKTKTKSAGTRGSVGEGHR
ncbi:MAG TPA: putative lipid II flippase FtsW [Acidimicrobiales bacterium]